MKLIIDVPEKIYNRYMNYTDSYVDFVFFGEEQMLVRAIRKSTPLPEGHEKLIVLSETKLKENQINLDWSCQKWISEVGLSFATVAIIKADKEN